MSDVSDQVVYDGFNFGENGLVVTYLNPYILPRRINQIETLANRNGGKLVQSQLSIKTIPIRGEFTGDTIQEAQEMYDTLATMLNRQERQLTVPHAGSTRTYTATPETAVLEEPDGLNRLTFDFEFVVPAGSSETETATTAFDTTITNPTATIPFTINGSVKARPFITLTFNSVTGGTGAVVSVRNARDFIGLTISGDFVSGDVITIDSDNFQIYINGTLTEPDGRMPTWSPGSGSLYYTDSFTDRDVDISMTYERKDI